MLVQKNHFLCILAMATFCIASTICHRRFRCMGFLQIGKQRMRQIVQYLFNCDLLRSSALITMDSATKNTWALYWRCCMPAVRTCKHSRSTTPQNA